MGFFEIIVIVACVVVIAAAAVYIYNQLNPPTPPPPPPPPVPPTPPTPPPPPPPQYVKVTDHPGRFTIQLINAPNNIKTRGQFRLQIVKAGTWTALEVADFTNAKIELEILDGDGQGTVSFLREFTFNNSTGVLGSADHMYLSKDVSSSGALQATVVSGGAPGSDVLSANIAGSPDPPVTAPYEIVP